MIFVNNLFELGKNVKTIGFKKGLGERKVDKLLSLWSVIRTGQSVEAKSCSKRNIARLCQVKPNWKFWTQETHTWRIRCIYVASSSCTYVAQTNFQLGFPISAPPICTIIFITQLLSANSSNVTTASSTHLFTPLQWNRFSPSWFSFSFCFHCFILVEGDS